ncbi:hypothetical protein VNO77_43869 [Canavalia gladiata]|uniref:Uncharacterized protein n=1 Tax=Canavalia gladiata TaxID=3824 RepID=A0AAN9JXJ4_CANGL
MEVEWGRNHDVAWTSYDSLPKERPSRNSVSKTGKEKGERVAEDAFLWRFFFFPLNDTVGLRTTDSQVLMWYQMKRRRVARPTTTTTHCRWLTASISLLGSNAE